MPRSQRGGEVVEPLVRDQWFVKMGPLAERALAAVAEGDVRIVPERFEKIYNHWLENIRVRHWHMHQSHRIRRLVARSGCPLHEFCCRAPCKVCCAEAL